MKKVTIVFASVYALIWLAPAIIVYPVDYLHYLVTGSKYVDGWTLGLLVWATSTVVLPAIFITIVLVKIIRRSNNVLAKRDTQPGHHRDIV